MHGSWTLVIALVGILTAPGVGAVIHTEAAITFEDTTRYTYRIDQVLTDRQATDLRDVADTNNDMLVDEAEAEAVGQAILELAQNESRSGHRLDGARPANITNGSISLSNVTGPVLAPQNVTLSYTLRFTYDSGEDREHWLRVHRETTPENYTFQVHIQGPPGWQLKNVTGFDTNASSFSFQHVPETQRAHVSGSPAGLYGIGLVPWNQTGGEPAANGTTGSSNETGSLQGGGDGTSEGSTGSPSGEGEPDGDPEASGGQTTDADKGSASAGGATDPGGDNGTTVTDRSPREERSTPIPVTLGVLLAVALGGLTPQRRRGRT